MKSFLEDLFKKYRIDWSKITIVFIVVILLVFRTIIQNNPELKLYHFISDYYSHFLLNQAKFILSFNHEILIDFTKNQITNGTYILNIDRFYFSINQIIAIFLLVLFTSSPVKDRIFYFMIGFLSISVYNALRISFHALYPETVSVHNWIFNLVLIPRWLIVIALYYFYWNKYTSIKNYINEKLRLSENFWNKIYLNLSLVNIVYFITIIIVFNRFFFLNGELLINFILATSKAIIDFMGYESWIDGKTITGNSAALFMDDSCIGVNLIFLFATFIALMPGAIKHKLWFIPMGILIIILFNSLRIALIFTSITNNEGNYVLPFEIHDLFTYPVLVLTFFLWIIWINRFSVTKLKNKIEGQTS